jgi:AcrR family transcriptional regulator
MHETSTDMATGSKRARGAKKRGYDRRLREEAAAETKSRMLASAKALFARRGIDAVTINEIAHKAGVSASTVYASFKSKEGVLLALMERTIFGERYRAAVARFNEVDDAVKQIAMTPTIARAIYESESVELGLMRGASAFSPALRKLERKFEDARLALQKARLERLFAERKAKNGLSFDAAQRLLWMYTSREIYRMLVSEGGWTPGRYEKWLSATLIMALVE